MRPTNRKACRYSAFRSLFIDSIANGNLHSLLFLFLFLIYSLSLNLRANPSKDPKVLSLSRSVLLSKAEISLRNARTENELFAFVASIFLIENKIFGSFNCWPILQRNSWILAFPFTPQKPFCWWTERLLYGCLSGEHRANPTIFKKILTIRMLFFVSFHWIFSSSLLFESSRWIFSWCFIARSL